MFIPEVLLYLSLIHTRCPHCSDTRLLKVELSKLAELNDSAGGYDWVWQKEAKALREKAQATEGVGVAEEDRDAKAALKLSMDNILVVSRANRD